MGSLCPTIYQANMKTIPLIGVAALICGATGQLGQYGSRPGGVSGSSFGSQGGSSSNGFGGSGGNSFSSPGRPGGFGGSPGGSSGGGIGASGSLEEAVPGIPGADYPIFAEVPPTSFLCDGQIDGGYYADPEADCQPFHICANDGEGGLTKYSFLCPNGTLFNQQYFICDWWFNVDCSLAESLYSLNADIAAEREKLTGSSGGSYRAPSNQGGRPNRPGGRPSSQGGRPASGSFSSGARPGGFGGLFEPALGSYGPPSYVRPARDIEADSPADEPRE